MIFRRGRPIEHAGLRLFVVLLRFLFFFFLFGRRRSCSRTCRASGRGLLARFEGSFGGVVGRQGVRHVVRYGGKFGFDRLGLAAFFPLEFQFDFGGRGQPVENADKGVAAGEGPHLLRIRRTDLHDPVSRLDTGRLGGAFREDVSHLDAQFRIVAHGDHAEKRGRRRREVAHQRQPGELEFFLAAANLQGNHVAFVFRSQDRLQFRVIGDRNAVDFQNHVAGLNAGLGRRGFRGDGSHCGHNAVEVGRLRRDADQAAAQILSLLEPGQCGEHVAERNGEPDAGVVPLDARGIAFAARRRRDQHAENPAIDIDERTAIVHRGNLGVGLDRFAVDAIERADDADRHRRRQIHVRHQGPTESDCPLANLQICFGRHGGHGQAGGVDFQQRHHAGVVRGHDLGDVTLFSAGDGDEHAGRLIREIEGAGDDVTIGLDD